MILSLKSIEQIRQNMTGHVTSRYQGLNSSDVGAKIENQINYQTTRLELHFKDNVRSDMKNYKIQEFYL